jgi:Kef-type K+ transport system membrane component KefB
VPVSSPAVPRAARPLWAAAGHLLLLAGAVVAFFAIRAAGEAAAGARVPPAGGTAAGPAAAAKPEVLPHVLLALLVIVAVSRLLARACAWVGQPPVIGETLGGILLGPSLLALLPAPLAEHVAPVYRYVLPPEVVPHLGLLAQLGVVLFMFLVGLELDAAALRERGRAAVAISQAGIVFPFLLGAALALALHPRLSGPEVPFTVFALFLGLAMAVTAFPVLARILADRGLARTPLGALALTCAASGDVAAWCLLALVVGVAQADAAAAASVLGGTAAYLLGMWFLGRPLLLRLLPTDARAGLSPGVVAAVLGLLLLSAWATEMIGIHALFGAFLFGAMIPHDSGLARRLTDKMHDLVTVLLLPVFFAYTGLRTQIGLVSGAEQWLVCGVIILVATLGKFGGALAAARLTGSGWRDAAALGVLMNTRGLMELVVLNVGLDLKVISPTLFAMMVLMALATTVATSPLLSLLVPAAAGRPREPPAAAGDLAD